MRGMNSLLLVTHFSHVALAPRSEFIGKFANCQTYQFILDTFLISVSHPNEAVL